jgi:transcriptional regulator with XRE-family HTH domain
MINNNFTILPGYISKMTDIRELLAKNIKKFRKIRGFSQEILAEKAFTSTTHIGMIEIGKKFPSPKMLEQIAEALGVDTPELFTTETVFFLPSNDKSVELLYHDIVNDFRLFEESVTKKILALNLKET